MQATVPSKLAKARKEAEDAAWEVSKAEDALNDAMAAKNRAEAKVRELEKQVDDDYFLEVLYGSRVPPWEAELMEPEDPLWATKEYA